MSNNFGRASFRRLIGLWGAQSYPYSLSKSSVLAGFYLFYFLGTLADWSCWRCCFPWGPFLRCFLSACLLYYLISRLLQWDYCLPATPTSWHSKCPAAHSCRWTWTERNWCCLSVIWELLKNTKYDEHSHRWGSRITGPGHLGCRFCRRWLWPCLCVATILSI